MEGAQRNDAKGCVRHDQWEDKTKKGKPHQGGEV